MWGHVDDKSRDEVGHHHREELDAWLSEAIGIERDAEKALLRHLGGAA
jgi:hypothetical protein